MKTINEFLSDLRRLDVKLWADGDDLCYRANKETLTPTLRQELKQRKVEIMAFLHQANTATNANLPPILPASRDKDLPLSFAQTRLWFLDQLEPGSSTYNMPAAYRLTGSLNIAALEQSLSEIVQRHEVLRTTFPSVDGQPSQAIAPHQAFTLPIIDLREHSDTEKGAICETQQRNAIAQQIATEEAQQPFALATGPLFRAKLLRLNEAESVLLLNMHHIVSDGWSFDVFFQELTALYTAFSNGQPSPLPSLPIQYADFAVWQRHWLCGEVLDSQLNYWKQQLGGNLPILQLPTDCPRPPVQTYQGADRSLELSLDLTKALKTLSQQESVTLFITLLTAFQTLLYRYSGQEDIIVGTPIAGRNQVETESLIGFFVNALGIRTKLSGNTSFLELLSQVREVALGAYSHQDLPFEKLVEELQPERDRSRSPLFQVMFALQNASTATLELPGININSLNIDSTTAKFDLTLFVKETKQGLVASLEYNTNLFSAATITRMLGHFQTLLEGIVANPKQCLSDLPLLTSAERYQLLVEWNETQAEYPKNKCIHELFEEQVEKTPDAIALVFEDEQLTYRELNARANQLAYYLQKLGVESEKLVGICVERSPLMVIGLLGILKAGGAYIPLDPSYPQERLALMLEDAQVSVLLTQQRWVEVLPPCSAQVVDLGTNELWEGEGIENLTSNIQSENLAYILYTSGSTGKPKGVAVKHRSVVALLSWATEVFTIEQLAGVLASTSFCFDISVFELFVPLSCGGKIILAENILHLLTLPAAEEVTLINTVPSAIAELVRTKGIPDSVKTVNLAGEALPQRLVQLIYQQNSIEKVFNLYGPSEDTIYSTYALVKRDGEKAPSIGRPVYNTQVYILDCHQQPVPIGVPGELHIGGVGLARGYLNRPKLTEEKFIQNPFNKFSKLYKTGDLARYLPDGNIEFLGRIDNQVKIRGFRIELGEIETAIRAAVPSRIAQNPIIEQTVVIAREDSPGDKRLVAYIVPHPEQTITTDELRRFLKQKLPDYMIPGAFVFLDTLPLTPNGKIDRNALPAPDKLRQESEETFVAPRDDLELQLTKIWEQVLGTKPISVTDNFFELGGHSLLAVRLFAQIEKTFGKNLSLATLFQAPNIEQLANIIRQKGWSSPWSSLVPIQPSGTKPILFCIHTLGIKLNFYRPLIPYLGREQPLYGLSANIANEKQDCLNQVETLATYYIKEMRILQPDGPYFLAGVSFGGLVAFEMAQQLVAQGQKVALLALLDTQGPDAVKRVPKNEVFSAHLNNLKEKGLSYLLEKIKQKITSYKDRIEFTFNLIYSKANQALGLPLPPPQQDLLITLENQEAGRHYQPQVYPGQLTLFRSMAFDSVTHYRDPELGWGSLATGGVEIHDVPGDHLGIFKEPSVQVLAEKLKASIDKAIGQTSIDKAIGETSLSDRPQLNKPIIESKKPAKIESKESTLQSSLVPIQPGGSKPPFFLAHGVGGHGLSFVDLVSYLGLDQPVYGLQAKGLDGKEPPYTRLEDMAAYYIQDIRTLQPKGPYFLGGHSFGGLLAFEIAQQLVTQGEEVALLAMLDRGGINEPITFLNWFSGHLSNLAQLEIKEQIAYVWGRVKWHITWKIPTPIRQAYTRLRNLNSPEQHLRHLSVLEANLYASQNYVMQAYPGKVTIFQASIASPSIRYAPQGGWDGLALGGVEIHDVPGDHGSILKEPNLQILAEKLKACLDKAQAEISLSDNSEPNKSPIEIDNPSTIESGESTLHSSLVPIQIGGVNPPFFCVPFESATALYYRQLAHHLGQDQPFYGLQYEGMDEKQFPQIQVEEMAARFIKQIQTIQTEGPYFLGGCRLGGLVAFEMAQQLYAQGQKVALLILFDTHAPGYAKRLQFKERFDRHLSNLFQLGPIYALKKVKDKSQWVKNRLLEIIEKITVQCYQRIKKSKSQPYNIRYLSVKQSNKQALLTYIPQKYPGTITLFEFSRKITSEGWEYAPEYGWSQLAPDSLEHYILPTAICTAFKEPEVQIVAEQMRACIDKAMAENIVQDIV